MENINEFKISGNMVRDPIIKGEEEKVNAFFTVAVNGPTGGADFISVKAFRSLAQSIGKSLVKGDGVEVTGRIKTSSYEKGKEKIYVTELIANGVRKLAKADSAKVEVVVEE